MVSKSLPRLVFAILFLVVAAVPRPAGAAPSDDACALITQDQMSKIFGVPVSAGVNPAQGFTKTCTWDVPAGPPPRLKFITLLLQTSNSFDAAKQLQQAGKFQVEAASGIGDDAYYSSLANNITSLIVKKGGAAFKIGMYGEFPLDKKKAMSRAMALEVLSKL